MISFFYFLKKFLFSDWLIKISNQLVQLISLHFSLLEPQNHFSSMSWPPSHSQIMKLALCLAKSKICQGMYSNDEPINKIFPNNPKETFNKATMGQKCCRPQQNHYPKHLTLLQLAYKQASDLPISSTQPPNPNKSPPQQSQWPSYQTFIIHLNKKGYIKTLCDYLSSHVHYINPVLHECKNKQASVRNKNPQMQIRYAIVAVDVCEKVVGLALELKAKADMQGNHDLSRQRQLERKNEKIYAVEQEFMKRSQKNYPSSRTVNPQPSPYYLHKSALPVAKNSYPNQSNIKNSNTHRQKKSNQHSTPSRSKPHRQKKQSHHHQNTLLSENKIAQITQEFQYNIYDISTEIIRDIRIAAWVLEQKYEKILAEETKEHPFTIKNQILIRLLSFLGKISQQKRKTSIKTDTKTVKGMLDELMECLMEYRTEKKNKDNVTNINLNSARFNPNQKNRSSLIMLKNETPLLPMHKIREHKEKVALHSHPTSSHHDSHHKSHPILMSKALQIAELTLKNYRNILQKEEKNLSNSNVYKQIVRQHMHQLLEYWASELLEEDDSHHEQKKKKTYNKNQSNDDLILDQSSSQQSERQLASTQKISQTRQESKLRSQQQQQIQQIMLEFFNSYFSYKQSEYIYKQLLSIFDHLHFNQKKIQPIENLLFRALKDYELREHVIYKWFEYLLDYLAVMGTSGSVGDNNQKANPQSSKNPNLIIDSSIIDQQQPALLQKQSSNPFTNYLQQIDFPCNFYYVRSTEQSKNLKNSIIGCIKTIRRWIISKQIEIKNILQYKSHKFFIALLVNLCRGHYSIKQEIVSLFQQLVYMDGHVYVGLVENSVLLLTMVRVDIAGVLKRIYRVYDEYYNSNSKSQQSFNSFTHYSTIYNNITNLNHQNLSGIQALKYPPNISLFLHGSHIIEELLKRQNLIQNQNSTKITSTKSNTPLQDKVWEKYQEQRSKSSLISKMSSEPPSSASSKLKKPPPLMKMGSSREKVMKNVDSHSHDKDDKKPKQPAFSHHARQDSNHSSPEDDRIIPVEEFIEEVIDVAAYGYFRDLKGYRRWREQSKQDTKTTAVKKQQFLRKQSPGAQTMARITEIKQAPNQSQSSNMRESPMSRSQKKNRFEEESPRQTPGLSIIKLRKIKSLEKNGNVGKKQVVTEDTATTNNSKYKHTEEYFIVGKRDIHEILAVLLKKIHLTSQNTSPNPNNQMFTIPQHHLQAMSPMRKGERSSYAASLLSNNASNTIKPNVIYLLQLAGKILQNSGLMSDNVLLGVDDRAGDAYDKSTATPTVGQQFDYMSRVVRYLAYFNHQCILVWNHLREKNEGNSVRNSAQETANNLGTIPRMNFFSDSYPNQQRKSKNKDREEDSYESQVTILLAIDAMQSVIFPSLLRSLLKEEYQTSDFKSTNPSQLQFQQNHPLHDYQSTTPHTPTLTPTINRQHYKNLLIENKTNHQNNKRINIEIVLKLHLKYLLSELNADDESLTAGLSYMFKGKSEQTEQTNRYLMMQLLRFVMECRSLWRAVRDEEEQKQLEKNGWVIGGTDIQSGIPQRKMVLQVQSEEEDMIISKDRQKKNKAEKQKQHKKQQKIWRQQKKKREKVREKMRKSFKKKVLKQDQFMKKVQQCLWLLEDILIHSSKLKGQLINIRQHHHSHSHRHHQIQNDQHNMITEHLEEEDKSSSHSSAIRSSNQSQNSEHYHHKGKEREKNSEGHEMDPQMQNDYSLIYRYTTNEGKEKKLHDLTQELLNDKSKEMIVEICSQAMHTLMAAPFTQPGSTLSNMRKIRRGNRSTDRLVNEEVFFKGLEEDWRKTSSGLPKNSTRYKIMKFFNLVSQESDNEDMPYFYEDTADLADGDEILGNSLKEIRVIGRKNEEKVIPLLIQGYEQYYIKLGQGRQKKQDDRKNDEEFFKDPHGHPINQNRSQNPYPQFKKKKTNLFDDIVDFECKNSAVSSSNRMGESLLVQSSFGEMINAAKKQ